MFAFSKTDLSVNFRERQNQEVRELEKQKERMERERHERDKMEREREREKQEREQERERQEKQKAEQSVNKHFEESLRRAQQKVRIMYILQCNSSSIIIVCACLNSYPLFKLNLQRTEQNSWNPISLPPPHRSSSEDDRKRAEQEHMQREQQRHLVVRSQEAARDRNYYAPTVVKEFTLECMHYFIVFSYIFIADTEAT